MPARFSPSSTFPYSAEVMLKREGSPASASASAGSGYSTLEKNMIKQKRQRFSNDQVRSLESIFQFEWKLAPQKKALLATELGLQPRQVAIWFQNKRARWKSREMGRELCVLQSRYNSLASQFHMLEKEKEWLISQVGVLRDALKRKRAKEKRYNEGDLFMGGSFGVGEGDEEFHRNWFQEGVVLNEYMGVEEDGGRLWV